MKSRMMSEYGDSSARAQVEQKQMQDKLRQVQIEMQKKAEEIEEKVRKSLFESDKEEPVPAKKEK